MSSEEIPTQLQRDLREFHHCLTHTVSQQVDPAVREVTAAKHLGNARQALGWFANVRSREGDRTQHLEALTLRSLLPSLEPCGAVLAFEYVQWLRSQRAVCASTEVSMLDTFTRLARHLLKDEARSSGSVSGGP